MRVNECQIVLTREYCHAAICEFIGDVHGALLGKVDQLTPLDKLIKRGLIVKGIAYVVSMSPETLKITRKGRRLGIELRWVDLISGESALAIALHASIGKFQLDEISPATKKAGSGRQRESPATSARLKRVSRKPVRRPRKRAP